MDRRVKKIFYFIFILFYFLFYFIFFYFHRFTRYGEALLYTYYENKNENNISKLLSISKEMLNVIEKIKVTNSFEYFEIYLLFIQANQLSGENVEIIIKELINKKIKNLSFNDENKLQIDLMILYSKFLFFNGEIEKSIEILKNSLLLNPEIQQKMEIFVLQLNVLKIFDQSGNFGKIVELYNKNCETSNSFSNKILINDFNISTSFTVKNKQINTVINLSLNFVDQNDEKRSFFYYYKKPKNLFVELNENKKTNENNKKESLFLFKIKNIDDKISSEYFTHKHFTNMEEETNGYLNLKWKLNLKKGIYQIQIFLYKNKNKNNLFEDTFDNELELKNFILVDSCVQFFKNKVSTINTYLPLLETYFSGDEKYKKEENENIKLDQLLRNILEEMIESRGSQNYPKMFLFLLFFFLFIFYLLIFVFFFF